MNKTTPNLLQPITPARAKEILVYAEQRYKEGAISGLAYHAAKELEGAVSQSEPTNDVTYNIALSPRELDHGLAALRCYQRVLEARTLCGIADDVAAIATDHGGEVMSPKEIDDLCDRLNGDQTPTDAPSASALWAKADQARAAALAAVEAENERWQERLRKHSQRSKQTFRIEED